MPIADDGTRWQWWWQYNQSTFLELRRHVLTPGAATGSADFYLGHGRTRSTPGLAPTRKQVVTQVIPVLARLLRTGDDRDTRSACLIALGKAGRTRAGEIDVSALVREHLQDADQRIRESAALALGILGAPAAIDDLVALCRDDARGRELVGRRAVHDRTRTFAAYGLGLLGRSAPDAWTRLRILTPMARILDDDRLADRNVVVGLVQGLSLLQPDPAEGSHARVLADVLEPLETFFLRDLGVGEQLLQAHCPMAAARLLGDARHDAGAVVGDAWTEHRRRWIRLCLDELDGRHGSHRSRNVLRQSCVLALGRLLPGVDGHDAPHADAARRLARCAREDPNRQTRYFALIALGRAGGDLCRSELMMAFERGNKAFEKPWAALGLGVLRHGERRRAREAGTDFRRDPGLARMLERALEDIHTPSARSAIALALGLAGEIDSAEPLRRLLRTHAHQDQLTSYLCLSLALMQAHEAKPDLHTVMADSVHRPLPLSHAAIALGVLGDKTVATRLQALLSEGETNLPKLVAIARGLGSIGDRRTIDPLIDVLEDDTLPTLSRSYAAAALGSVVDDDLPGWNAVISSGTNYRAAVETLTNGSTGVLDIP